MIVKYMQIRNSWMYIVKYAMSLCSTVLRLGIYLCASQNSKLGYYIRYNNYLLVRISIIVKQIK